MKLATILLGAQALFVHAMASPASLDAAPAPAPNVDIVPRDNSNSTSLESRVVVRAKIWGLFSTGATNEFVVKGNNFAKTGYYNCGAAHLYQDFTNPLPFVLQAHPGNACHVNAAGAEFDNLWLHYASQHLNTPTDSRCGRVGILNLEMRCIIKQRP